MRFSRSANVFVLGEISTNHKDWLTYSDGTDRLDELCYNFRNPDQVLVSVSIDFPLNSKQDAPFHCIAYDYSRADWDGLRNHLRDVPWEDHGRISLNSKLVLLLVNFVSGFR